MNRRVVLPATIVGLALCFAIIALPVSGAESSIRLQATEAATADACNPEPAVPGRVLSNMFLVDQPAQSGIPLLQVFATDVVEVLGKNKTGFWVLVRTNSGIVGWLPSPQVFVEMKLFANATMVPVWEGPLPEATEAPEGTSEATEAASDANGACPVVDALVTADAFQLQIKPLTNSGNVGRRVRKAEHVVILALNASGSWAKVQTDTGEIGWISTAYTAPTGGVGKLSRVRKDYTSVEATLTPRP